MTTTPFYPSRPVRRRVTIIVSEPYKTLIDELARTGILRKIPVARWEHEGLFTRPRRIARVDYLWVSESSPYVYRRLAQRYPQWLDELSHIAAASLLDPQFAHLTIPDIYNQSGTLPHDQVYRRLLDAYTRAPAELADHGLNIPQMVRNFNRVFFVMQSLLPDRESEFAPRVHALLRNPPPAALDNDYRHIHNLHMGLLVYCKYPTDAEHIRDALQRMGDAAQELATRSPRHATDDVEHFAELAQIAPVSTPLLPIIHRLGEAHGARWSNDFAPLFLQAFVGGRGAFPTRSGDELWVKNTLRPIVAEALDKLMDARDFRYESVDAVFRTLLESIKPEDYAEHWVQPVLKKYTAHLLRNLVAAYANRVPEHAGTIVRRTAQLARTPALIDKFSELVVGSTETDYDIMEERMPDTVRGAAKQELIRLYPRLRGRITPERKRVAVRLTMAFFGIRPTAAFYDGSSDRDKVARWETAIQIIRDPQRLLRDPRNAAFARWLDHAQREALAKDLCRS
jgi:hypothetical protein